MRKMYVLLLSVMMTLLLVPQTWSKDVNLKSIWAKTQMTVDEEESEWSGSIYYLEKQKIGIGLQNDSANLYVLVKATDRGAQAQIMRRGLTIWLDAKGKAKKTLGIHFPIGMLGYGIPDVRPNPNTEFAGEQQARIAEMLREIEVLGPEKNDRNRISMTNSFGIEASLKDTLGTLICELKIPLILTSVHPYAVSSGPGSAISVGLETGKFDREMAGEHMRMRGMMPGGERRMPPGEAPSDTSEAPEGMRSGARERGRMPVQIDIWAKVSLAKAAGDKN